MCPYRALLEQEWAGQNDPSHDIAHIERVLASALKIQAIEGGDISILIPAIWFHDLVNLPKDHRERHKASAYSADRAIEILQGEMNDKLLQAVYHAIAAHSFSAKITPQTLEAKILQDADRLDALGCIGIMRTFAVSGELGRALFDADDPFSMERELDDTRYALDHFEVKLFKVAETLHTETAREMAQQRISFMRQFQQQLAIELGHSEPASADQRRSGT